MCIKYCLAFILAISLTSAAVSQRPPGQSGRPGMPIPGGGPPPRHDWFKVVDADKDGKVSSTEFQAAIDTSFAEFDRNSNGTIDSSEIQRPPRVVRPTQPMGPRLPPETKKMLPPFFFADRVADGVSTNKAEFEKIVRGVFSEMDKNADGYITRDETHPPRRPDNLTSPPPGFGPPPNARFIGAELRFGDKLITGRAFSADVLIEDTRRLFDGSTVTKQRRGAIYRDGDGRTRREQPLETVGGFNIVGGNNKPLSLVFINDFVANTQVFLDINNKTARTSRIGNQPKPFEQNEPEEAKTETLGTKIIDGVKVEGTRTTFEIPVGHLGNDKPIEVVTEKWFSPELQIIVMLRHLDPLAGEHIFKLVNIKRGEPSADLFKIPTGFRIEKTDTRLEPKKDDK